jgi:hypothetical protein
MKLRFLAILLALFVLPAAADENTPQSSANRIVQYEAAGGDMLANADVDWNRYTKILLDRATVEFREGWVKDQQRLNNNMVTERDLAQIRSWISEMLQEALSNKISDTDGYALSEVSGTDVLRYTPRVAKLDILAPGNAQAIVGNVLVDGKGAMVVVIDISDSVSGELLASAWRLEVDPDKGYAETATEAGNKTAFKRMMGNWTEWLFAMLDHLRAEKPGTE